MGWSKDPGPPKDGDLPRHFFLQGGEFMDRKILSVFIDESGDFGPYNFHSPNYYVTLLFHEQDNDISKRIELLDEHLRNCGIEHPVNWIFFRNYQKQFLMT